MLSLPSLFAPSIQYVRLLLDHPEACIYVGEQYEKQTLRNRTYIMTPQGATHFTVPVARYGYPSPSTSEILLAEHDQWRHRLEEALRSSYCSSPYWQYYEDEIVALCRYGVGGTLCDFNQQWLALLLLEWEIPLPRMTDDSTGLEHHPEAAMPSWASSYSPTPQPRYWQVFEERNGFLPGLSALDLLFHLGLEGRLYLKSL